MPNTHGMVTIVATQSRPAMMRRVRERFGRVENGWMIVRYLGENDFDSKHLRILRIIVWYLVKNDFDHKLLRN